MIRSTIAALALTAFAGQAIAENTAPEMQMSDEMVKAAAGEGVASGAGTVWAIFILLLILSASSGGGGGFQEEYLTQ